MSDPIVAAIEAFETGLAYFNAIPSSVTERLEDQIIAATYGPPMDVLANWTAPAETLEGAIAALRLAVKENDFNAASDIASNMTKAALAYFDRPTMSGGTSAA